MLLTLTEDGKSSLALLERVVHKRQYPSIFHIPYFGPPYPTHLSPESRDGGWYRQRCPEVGGQPASRMIRCRLGLPQLPELVRYLQSTSASERGQYVA